MTSYSSSPFGVPPYADSESDAARSEVRVVAEAFGSEGTRWDVARRRPRRSQTGRVGSGTGQAERIGAQTRLEKVNEGSEGGEGKIE